MLLIEVSLSIIGIAK